MKKIISAKDILKSKGYAADKFDTDGFMEAVASFFINHEVKDKLLIVCKRFLDIETEEVFEDKREKFLFSETRRHYEANYYYWRVSNNDRAKGWKAQCETDKDGHPLFIRELCEARHYPPSNVGDTARPRIVVDSPYYENALFLLQTMAGYTVDKRNKRDGIRSAFVSLI